MRIVSWNVNSVRTRLDRLCGWLADQRPDVVCLQELKVTDDAFPEEPFEDLDYYVVTHGQKTYNGVGILSTQPIDDVQRGLEGDEDDDQARLIAATTGGVRVISAYVPNGSEMTSEKYPYKLAWLRRLLWRLEHVEDLSAPLALCGDFNIARDDRDAAFPDRWEGGVLYNDEVRGLFDEILALGLTDTLRQHTDEGGVYSWWDYRRLAFPKNDGLRIDYVLASAALASRCTAAGVERDQRKGTKPSDHAPVWADFDAP